MNSLEFSLLLSEKPRHWRWDFGFMTDTAIIYSSDTPDLWQITTHTQLTHSRKKLPFLNPFFNTSNPSSTSNAFWSHCHSLWFELNIMDYATQSSVLNQKHVPALFPPPVTPSCCQAMNHILPRAIIFSHWVVFTFFSIFILKIQHLLQKPEMSLML